MVLRNGNLYALEYGGLVVGVHVLGDIGKHHRVGVGVQPKQREGAGVLVHLVGS